MSRIQCILCKPHAKEKDDQRRRMVIPCHKISSSVDLVYIVCEACQLVKQRALHTQSKCCTIIDDKGGNLSKDILTPGQRVSCDQYISTVLGRRGHTFGKEIEMKRLVGGTKFVDHATNFITHQHQINLTCSETVCSKHFSESLSILTMASLSRNILPTIILLNQKNG